MNSYDVSDRFGIGGPLMFESAVLTNLVNANLEDVGSCYD